MTQEAYKDEVEATLDKIFNAARQAIKANANNITLDNVDNTLGALFEAISQANKQGNKAKVPDFRKFLIS